MLLFCLLIYVLNDANSKGNELATLSEYANKLVEDNKVLAKIVVAGTDDYLEYEVFFTALAHYEGYKGVDGAAGEKGPYQINEPYWIDAKINGAWSDVNNHNYARLTMIRYWQRYCPEAIVAKDWHTLAAIHNGGPTGNKKEKSIQYADRVINLMDVVKQDMER